LTNFGRDPIDEIFHFLPSKFEFVLNAETAFIPLDRFIAITTRPPYWLMFGFSQFAAVLEMEPKPTFS
jgi:hypothetical protein